jgi:hypothetical protein
MPEEVMCLTPSRRRGLWRPDIVAAPGRVVHDLQLARYAWLNHFCRCINLLYAGVAMRVLGILFLVAVPFLAGATESGFTNVKGGSISGDARVTGRDPGDVVVFVDFPQSSFSADLQVDVDHQNDASEVSVDLGGWLCFQQKITFEVLSTIVEEVRVEVVGDFINRGGSRSPGAIRDAQATAFRVMTDAVEKRRLTARQHMQLDWPVGDFSVRFPNCYTVLDIQKLQSAMLPAISGRIARSLSPGSGKLPAFADPFTPGPAYQEDDPIELGDKELIQ